MWLDDVIDNIDAEVVIRALAKRGWNEKNFQVSSVNTVFLGPRM